MEFNYLDMKNLTELMKPPDLSDTDSDDDLPKAGLNKIGPGHIGNTKVSGNAASTHASKEDLADSDTIWAPDEVPEGQICDDNVDPRQKPEYDIKYRQAVTAEDIYLQMGGRTPSTASCEDMVLSIELPGETYSGVDLTVTRDRLDVRSPMYRLGLDLPHPVDPDSSRAKWDEQEGVLTVLLRMVREFDFVNF